MKTLFTILSAALLLTLSAQAEEVIWSGDVQANGTRTQRIPLVPGEKYIIQAEGSMDFGTWWKTGKTLMNDACYEFHAEPDPREVPVLMNDEDVTLCEGTYNADHLYSSEPFIASKEDIQFWVFDSDYSDNNGALNVRVVRTEATTPVENSLYLVARPYFPLRKEQQPAAKPLDALDIATVEFVPVDNPMFLEISKENKELFPVEIFDMGSKIALPIRATIKTPEGKEKELFQGAFLLEIVGHYPSEQKLIESYPQAHPQNSSQSGILRVDQTSATFSNTSGSTTFKGGPIEEGWSDTMKEENLKLLKSLHQSQEARTQ